MSTSPYDVDLEADLATLVPAWLDWSEAAERLGVSVSRVRTMVREHQLAQAVPVAGEGPRIPAEMLVEDPDVGWTLAKGLPGLLTVLHDNRFDDRECIAWLFADQGFPGRAIDALRENRGSEVKRRAQALAS